MYCDQNSSAFKLGVRLGTFFNKIFFNQKKENAYFIRTEPMPLEIIKPIRNINPDKDLENLYYELLKVCSYQSNFQDQLFDYHTYLINTNEIDPVSYKAIIDQIYIIEQTMLHNDQYITNNILLNFDYMSQKYDANLYEEILKTQGYQSVFLKQLHLVLHAESGSNTPEADIDRIIRSMMQNSQWIIQMAEKIDKNKLVRQEINGYPEVKSLLNIISSKDKIC
jgi:hypothetical protein